MQDTLRVAVIGTGQFAQGMANVAQRSRFNQIHSLVIGSRRITDDLKGESHQRLDELPNIPLMSVHEAIKQSDVIILCIPCTSYTGFVNQYSKNLHGKILVDVSNPTKKQVRQLDGGGTSTLVRSLRECNVSASIVKAFNSFSAYGLLSGQPSGTQPTKIVGSTQEACNKVERIAVLLGFPPMHTIPMLEIAEELEKKQIMAGQRWIMPFIVNFIFFAVTLTYNMFLNDKSVFRDRPTFDMVWMQEMYIAFGFQSLLGFVVTYLPGPLLHCFIRLSGRKSVKVWSWYKSWLSARKELGLLAALAMLAHLLGAYLDIGMWAVEPRHHGATEPFWGVERELAMILGVLATVFCVPVAITSMPSIGASLSWGDWMLWQQMGWIVLALSVLHAVYVRHFHGGLGDATYGDSWKKYIKIPVFLAYVFPITLLPFLFKFISLLPCLEKVPILQCFVPQAETYPSYVMTHNKQPGNSEEMKEKVTGRERQVTSQSSSGGSDQSSNEVRLQVGKL